MIKKYIQKQMLKLEIISDLPGRLRLKSAHYKAIPKEALDYVEEIYYAIRMLEGIQSIQFNHTIGTLLIAYDVSKLSKRSILKWLDIITATGIEHAEFIEQYGDKDPMYVKRTIEDKLKMHLKEMR